MFYVPYPYADHTDDGLQFIKGFLTRHGAWAEPIVDTTELPAANRRNQNNYTIMQDSTHSGFRGRRGPWARIAPGATRTLGVRGHSRVSGHNPILQRTLGVPGVTGS